VYIATMFYFVAQNGCQSKKIENPVWLSQIKLLA
jgi:hypothetical protein